MQHQIKFRDEPDIIKKERKKFCSPLFLGQADVRFKVTYKIDKSIRAHMKSLFDLSHEF